MTRIVPYLAGIVLASLTMAKPARASHGHTCREISEVVGDRKCGRFGDRWATERSMPLFAAIGPFSGVARPIGARTSSIDEPLRSYGANVQLGGFVSPYAYLGVEWAFGLGRVRGAPAQSESGFYAQGWAAILLGGRVPLGRFSLRLEAAAGVQLLSAGWEERMPDGPRKIAANHLGVLLAPRAAVDWWMTPDTTFSAWLGTNVVRPGDYTMGVAVALHGRSFDGAYR